MDLCSSLQTHIQKNELEVLNMETRKSDNGFKISYRDLYVTSHHSTSFVYST